MYNECDSLTSRQKISLDGLTCCKKSINQNYLKCVNRFKTDITVTCTHQFLCIYPTPLHKQDATQVQFLNRA